MSDLNDEDDRRMWVRYIACDVCELEMRDWTCLTPKPFDRKQMSDEVGAALAKRWNNRIIPGGV